MGLSRKGWQRAVNVLLWYPDNLKEYATLLDEAITRDPEHHGGTTRPLMPDPTADAAIRLASNRRADTLRAEIEAVELAMAELPPIEREVIRRRFWEIGKWQTRKPRQYDYLQDLPYSRRQMIRIVKKVIYMVAVHLGEN